MAELGLFRAAVPLIVGLCLFAGSAQSLDRIVPKSLFKEVESVLEADAALLEEHRGYLGYVTGHPKRGVAEEAWWDLETPVVFRRAAGDFDEALLRDPEAQALFDAFYDLLARDEGLRTAVGDLRRAEFALGEEALAAVMTQLRGNPSEALRFLNVTSRMRPVQEGMGPLSEALRRRPALREALRGPFETIARHPLARTRLLPWWRRLAAKDAGSGGAYSALAQQFAAHSDWFWVWHQRHVALAGDAQARSWIRHWHRVVRRTPGLADDYYRYLTAFGKDPGHAERARLYWDKIAGPAAAWPPKAAPPELEALAGPASERRDTGAPVTPTRSGWTGVRPARPVMPTAPARPSGPARPNSLTKPDAPTRPARPKAPSP